VDQVNRSSYDPDGASWLGQALSAKAVTP